MGQSGSTQSDLDLQVCRRALCQNQDYFDLFNESRSKGLCGVYYRVGLSARRIIDISREMKPDIQNRIFEIDTPEDFHDCTLEIFRLQILDNKIYSEFLKNLSIDTGQIRSAGQIPFLPVGFFRTQRVVTGTLPVTKVFESSGTSGNESSR